ncbi:MAG: polysaccharide deacetylase family protein [Alphaproteobacteria bacterium]|nr:polysaccharide deacetylase family protein [Alphaproteobacteria bacterium]
MRNALSLMVSCVIATGLIIGMWYLTFTHASQTAAWTISVRPNRGLPLTLPAPALPTRVLRNDVDVTASVPAARATARAQSAPAAACANSDALGIGRVVEIDTSEGPSFGNARTAAMDFLNDKEVVLSFDDGPWPGNTPAVLKALADECTTGVFFTIGKHASYHPELLRQVQAAGHIIGTHTWSHANLNSKKLGAQQVKDEVEKGFSAAKLVLGNSPAPLFRFPQLQSNAAAVSYLAQRHVGMFSADIDSLDFRRTSTPDKIVERVMSELEKRHKGIILMHDFQKNTAIALPALLRRLKEGGYRVVRITTRAPYETEPEYDAAILKDFRMPALRAPLTSAVRTVSQ